MFYTNISLGNPTPIRVTIDDKRTPSPNNGRGESLARGWKLGYGSANVGRQYGPTRIEKLRMCVKSSLLLPSLIQVCRVRGCFAMVLCGSITSQCVFFAYLFTVEASQNSLLDGKAAFQFAHSRRNLHFKESAVCSFDHKSKSPGLSVMLQNAIASGHLLPLVYHGVQSNGSKPDRKRLQCSRRRTSSTVCSPAFSSIWRTKKVARKRPSWISV